MANDFQSVFDHNEEVEEEFDTIFGGQEDGELIDVACGFNESGECETDFDEIHQTEGDSDPDDMAHDLRTEDETINTPDNAEGTSEDPNIDLAMGEGVDPSFDELHQLDRDATTDCMKNDLRVDDPTDNAPSGAEGTDQDPAIDLAMGECGDEFSADGVPGTTDADDFYDGYNEPEDPSATTGEGSDVNMDNQNIEDEFDKIAEAVASGQNDEDTSDSEEEIQGENPEDKGLTEGQDMDQFMNSLDGEDNGEQEECSAVKESDEYEEGDADLIDLVTGDDE